MKDLNSNTGSPKSEKVLQANSQEAYTVQNKNQKKGKFASSWQLFKAALAGLNSDKEIVLLMLVQQIFVILLAGLLWYLFFASPFREILYNSAGNGSFESNTTPAGWAVVIVIGLIITTTASLLEGAVCSAAFDRFNGKNPTIGTAVSAAMKKFAPLAMFSIVTFAVRFAASKASESSNGIATRSIAKLANTAWTIMTYFSIPVIILSNEPVGPIKSIKYSIDVLKKNWGESLIANFGIGVVQTVFIVVLVLIFGPIMLVIAFSGAPLALLITAGIIFIFTIVLVSLFFSVLSVYVKSALFYFVQFKKTPEVFSNINLAEVFSVKK